MEAPKITTCHGITAKGIRCQKTVKGAQFCFHHKAQANSPAANAPELSDMDVEFDGNDEDTETGREADLDAQKAELRRQIEELSSYPPSMAETDIVEPLQVARPTTQTQEVRIRSKARTRGREQQQRESLPLQEATLATHNLATAYQPARADTIASSKASSTTSSKAQEWLTRTDPAAEALIKDLDRQTASINPNPTPTPTPDHLKLSTENTHLRTTLAAAHRRLTAESKAAAKMRDEARSASDELQTANAKCARAIDELEKTRSRNDELKKSMTDLKRRETKSDKFSVCSIPLLPTHPLTPLPPRSPPPPPPRAPPTQSYPRSSPCTTSP